MTVSIIPASNPQVVISDEKSTVQIELTGSSAIELIAAGPQGPPGPIGSGLAVNDAAKVDKSVIYYDTETASFKADAIWTVFSLTDGGNF